MSVSMPNDHYISRFLTKPWEIGHRRLHYYDFASAKFGDSSSESLFAAADLHTETTGKHLDRYVESPVSDYRARVLRASTGPALADTNDWRVYRGLVGLVWLQVQRLLDAKALPVEMNLDQLLTQAEAVFDAMPQLATRHHALIGVTVPSTENLFFTESVYFPIPLVGAPPILGVPLSPRHFVALAPTDYDKSQLRYWLNTPAAITAFSVGVGENAHRIVIPPDVLAPRHSHSAAFSP